MYALGDPGTPVAGHLPAPTPLMHTRGECEFTPVPGERDTCDHVTRAQVGLLARRA